MNANQRPAMTESKVDEFRKDVQRRLESIKPPKNMTELRAEYRKAGARAVVREVNAALAACTPAKSEER